MKVHILGSCSGTEPMPGRHHTSLVIEAAGRLYWIDAGENAAYTAYLMGLDVFQMQALFLSHPHIDHVGGLPLLLYLPHKLAYRQGRVADHAPCVFLADWAPWKGTLELMKYIEACCVNHDGQYIFPGGQVAPVQLLQDGLVFEDAVVTVEARHNLHLGASPSPEDGRFHSYSFRICGEGQTVLVSADVSSHHDLGDWLESPVNLLLMESGHHSPAEVCASLRKENTRIGQILFYHHGRALLNHYEETRREAEEAWGKPLLIAEDATTYDIPNL